MLSKRLWPWLVGLSPVALAAIWMIPGEEPGPQSGALIEIENRTGQALESIEVIWAGNEKRWPGLERGQSALIPIDLQRAGSVTLGIPPYGTMVEQVSPGQRLYLYLSPQAIRVERIPASLTGP